jgi:hypothetical protein
MWIELSEGVYYFGPGGITVLKEVDLRDKPSTFKYRTELYANSVRIDLVKETVQDILDKLKEAK